MHLRCAVVWIGVVTVGCTVKLILRKLLDYPRSFAQTAAPPRLRFQRAVASATGELTLLDPLQVPLPRLPPSLPCGSPPWTRFSASPSSHSLNLSCLTSSMPHIPGGIPPSFLPSCPDATSHPLMHRAAAASSLYGRLLSAHAAIAAVAPQHRQPQRSLRASPRALTSTPASTPAPVTGCAIIAPLALTPCSQVARRTRSLLGRGARALLWSDMRSLSARCCCSPAPLKHAPNP